jgi:hypothetical protein
MINKNSFVPNMSMSIQTVLAAEAQPAEGQFLLDEQTLNKAKYLMYQARTPRQTVSKTKGQNLVPRQT